MMRAYSLAGFGLTPLLHIWLKRRIARGKEDAARQRERFGHASAPRPQGKLVWLHAASVGEAQSVLTLSRALLSQHGDASLLITTGTVTSAALIAQQQLPRTIHQFLPVDTFPAVNRFLKYWRPDMVLWVESEFWPQMLWQLKRRRIPALLINARLSARSQKGWKRWPRTIRQLLSCFRAIYAGSADDAARLRLLGAVNVIEAGNVKYDASALPIDADLQASMHRAIGARPLWVAASTHANEEQMIAGVHKALVSKFPGLLTIIVPRHAARGDAIAADLRARGTVLAQRSRHESITADTGIYLADTMGELGNFYHMAPIVFLGGSLIAHGGHNPLEPARLDCALLTGPHMHNFAAITDHLVAEGALQIVNDTAALESALAALLTDAGKRKDMAQRAARVVASARGASEQILARCKEILA